MVVGKLTQLLLGHSPIVVEGGLRRKDTLTHCDAAQFGIGNVIMTESVARGNNVTAPVPQEHTWPHCRC